MTKSPKSPHTTAETERLAAERRARLAAELRANLARRKRQGRERAAPADKSPDKEGSSP